MSCSLTRSLVEFAFPPLCLDAHLQRWSTRLGASRATILRPGDSSYIAPLVEPPDSVSVIRATFARLGRKYHEAHMFSVMFSDASGTASLFFLGLCRPGYGCRSVSGVQHRWLFYRCLLIEGVWESVGAAALAQARNTSHDVQRASCASWGCSGGMCGYQARAEACLHHEHHRPHSPCPSTRAVDTSRTRGSPDPLNRSVLKLVALSWRGKISRPGFARASLHAKLTVKILQHVLNWLQSFISC